jgi:predicted ester cyclase
MSAVNMKYARRLLEEVWTDGNLALLPEFMAEDSVGHPMPQVGALQGREQYRNFIAVYKGIFLETRFTIEEQFASGDRVATRGIGRVTEASGDARKDVRSGAQLTVSGATITHHDSGGKIVAEWAYWDTHNLVESAAAPRIFEQLSISI